MNQVRKSLLDGRNVAPLDQRAVNRAAQTFIALDDGVNARYEADSWTRFQVAADEATGEEYGEIVFSADLYPGQNIANPNAILSPKAAAAHELAHFYRWESKTELPHGKLVHIDEAMTSLEAALRYAAKLSSVDTSGLISDALERLRRFVLELEAGDH